jgi:RimJ/RimL family protein N-acetyltransferase
MRQLRGPFVFLETERLILRRFTAADADNLFELDSDPEVMRYLNGGTPTSRHVVENDVLPRFLRSYERYGGFGYWAAIEKTSGAFIGWFGLRPRDDQRFDEVELGYRLRQSAWRKGYATEGSRALIRKGFSELGVQRVYATTYEDNLASRRVMEKSGLTLVRRYRMTPTELAADGNYHGAPPDLWPGFDVEYAIEKDEWEQQEAARQSLSISK